MKFWPVVFLALPLAAQTYDIVVRNGLLVDGTGNASYRGDLAVKDGKIAAMGRIPGAAAATTIDAKGKIVAPGFIDIHNHSDFTILEDGNAQSMIRQGVTSMIFGEGGSAAPSRRYARLKDYFAAVQKSGVANNIATFVGSSQVWVQVRGERAGPPTAEELGRMRTLVREAMEDGALGVASSLSGPPGAWIDTNTLVEMCKVAGEFGGIYSTHQRTEGFGVFESVAEAMDIGKRANVPVDVIHIKIAEHKLWGQMPELIGSIQNARRNGQMVEANLYPYRAGQNNLSSIVPPWAHEGGDAAMLKRLRDPATAPRIRREIENGIPGSNWYNHYTATGGWEGMLLASFANPAYQKYTGWRMSEVIKDRGKDGIDVLFELLEANNGSVPTVYFHHSEEDMQFALKQPFVSIGSDGSAIAVDGPHASKHPHPRWYGTFPRVLGRYVRELKVISMEEAIRKMTSANAAKIRIFDRGILRPGLAADITIFDPARVTDRATFEKPHQYAEGIDYVIVNGKLVLDRGKHTGARPGAVLYGQGYRR
jgi:N-acyl-D-aspartate/D-glutamate deacylase